MTTPAVKNLDIYQGDDYDILIRVKGRNAVGDMEYLDMTDALPKAQIRAAADAEEILAEFTAVVTDQVTTKGGILYSLSGEDTAVLVLANAVWDCEVVFPPALGGQRKTLLKGTVTVTKQVTR